MKRFIFSIGGGIALILVFGALVAFTLYQRYAQDRQNFSPPPPPVISDTVDPLEPTPDSEPDPGHANRSLATRTGERVAKLIVPEAEEVAPVSAPQISREDRARMLADPVRLSLYYSEPPPPPPPPVVSDRYAPYGRMIRCKLVTSLESSNLSTPLVAITTESIWNRAPDGTPFEIIPAGIEVHGPPVARGRSRDRLAADGEFVFVWRTNDEFNGQELSVRGIALTRDTDPTTDLIGPADASAGIRGDIIETAGNREIRLFAAAFLKAAASGGYQTSSILNPLTNQTVTQAEPGLRNAAVAGVEAVLGEWANRIRDEIDQEGFFVAVPAGREFYLYINQTIDLRAAQRGLFATSSPPTTTDPAQ